MANVDGVFVMMVFPGHHSATVLLRRVPCVGEQIWLEGENEHRGGHWRVTEVIHMHRNYTAGGCAMSTCEARVAVKDVKDA